MAESGGKIVSNNTNLSSENKSGEHSESLEETKTEPVMEPLLLEDYRENAVPLSVSKLFKYLKEEGIVIDKNVTLVTFIYILMLETGFVPSEFANLYENTTYHFHYKRLLTLTNSMPKNWKNNASYTFSFILGPFPEDVCKVTCVCVTDDVVINCSVRNIPESNVSFLVDPRMYIVDLSADGSSRIFQNLRDLSKKIKTVIANHCKTLILESHSFRSLSLQGMPPEICLLIFKYCDGNTIVNLDKTCRYFKSLCIKLNLELFRSSQMCGRLRQYCVKYLSMR